MRSPGTITGAALLVAFSGIVSLSVLVAMHPFDRTPLPARGGRTMSVREIPTPKYLQRDQRWSAERLAGTAEPLAISGCTICCVSMALGSYGIAIAPGELNRRISRRGGFTRQGWLRWSWVGKISGGRLETDTPRRPEFEAIDEALLRRRPVLARIRLKGEVVHWVLIVAKQGREYFARDPLVDESLVRVSSRSPVIEAIRIIRPAD